jgi:hypothetical protein
MSKVINLPRPNANSAAFGGCPTCLCIDNVWNVFKSHWAVCHRHKTKWYLGANLFSNWRQETEADWLRNKYRLAEYREVEPVFPNLSGDA